MNQFIEIRHVVKRFGTNTVLKDISLEVRKSEMVTLLGPSGCGKSTLLRAIAGLNDVDEGQVFIDGQDVTDVDVRKRRVGMGFGVGVKADHLGGGAGVFDGGQRADASGIAHGEDHSHVRIFHQRAVHQGLGGIGAALVVADVDDVELILVFVLVDNAHPAVFTVDAGLGLRIADDADGGAVGLAHALGDFHTVCVAGVGVSAVADDGARVAVGDMVQGATECVLTNLDVLGYLDEIGRASCRERV